MRISRSKIDRFFTCPRCGWLEFVHHLSPPSIPFTLNMTVDELLKKEFDQHRAAGTVHPVVKHLGYDFVPFKHPKIDDWRDTKIGLSRVDPDTAFEVFGAVDDLWIANDGGVVVVDYKATSRTSPMKRLGTYPYHDGYRRQLDIYCWLLQGQSGITVSNKAYWLYVTARRGAAEFAGRLAFDPALIEYKPNVSWIEPFLKKIRAYADSPIAPESGAECELCVYRHAVERVAASRPATS
jgi:CRISPR/Cas system-associated exonuclease Cas4 (RecB family)